MVERSQKPAVDHAELCRFLVEPQVGNPVSDPLCAAEANQYRGRRLSNKTLSVFLFEIFAGIKIEFLCTSLFNQRNII